jgi:hypothetical protein
MILQQFGQIFGVRGGYGRGNRINQQLTLIESEQIS